jgi:hypothetical protein
MLVGFKIISSRFVLLILSKSLRKAFLKCSFSLQFKKKWFSSSRVNNELDLGNHDLKKNSCKKYYKNILIIDYEEIFDNK